MSINWTPTEYSNRAAQTRRQRQADGRYMRPTMAQVNAFKKSMQRDGNKSLTVEEMGLLAAHPYLTHSQRDAYAAMAQAAIAAVQS